MKKKTICKIILTLNLLLLAVSSTHAQVEITKVPTYESLEKMIDYSKTLERRPYRNGATGPYAFDCSGFTQFCYKTIGVELNRTSAQQAEQGKKIRKQKYLKPGDLVCFNGSKIGKTVGHVGIVVENNDGVFTFIHASSSVGITISRSDTKYYADRYVVGRRITDNKKIRRALKKYNNAVADGDLEEEEAETSEKKERKGWWNKRRHRKEQEKQESENKTEKKTAQNSDNKKQNNNKETNKGNDQLQPQKTVTEPAKRDAKETVENAFKNNANKADTTKVKPADNSVAKDTTKNEPAKTADSNSFSKSVHKVEKGDTLYNIARRAGCSVQQLRDWNHLTSDALSIGQELRVK